MNIIKQMLQEMNAIGFWKVLTGWSRIKRWIMNNLLEVQGLIDAGARDREELHETQRELGMTLSTLEATELRVTELVRDKAVLESQMIELRNRLREQDTEVLRLRNADDQRQIEHQKNMQTTRESRDEYLELKRRINEAQLQEQQERFERQRVTWQQHQENVQNKLRLLCEKLTIEYVNEVPFRGTPDNTLLICNEYVVFDAKSPGGEDLSNFSNYLKREAENVKKYAAEENVRSDIFFVAPSNTLETLAQAQTPTQFVFPTHRVYIIPVEALEPVLITLQKIEEYEFAEQLSPEERENICRLIGRMIHHLKRRIQVNNFMDKEALTLANDLETLLPPEFHELVEKIQRAIKLNPPQERSGKDISTVKLEKETKQVEKGMENLGVVPIKGILPLDPNQIPPYGETAN